MTEKKYSRLLESLLQATVDAQHLQAFLDLLVDAMGATTGNILSADQYYSVADFAFSHGIPEEELVNYAREYWKFDLWRIGAEQTGLEPGRVVRGRELVDDETLLSSEFYQRSLRNFDIFHWCGVTLQPAATQRVLVSVQRPRAAGPFPDQAVSLLEQLSSHIENCVRVIRTNAENRMQQNILFRTVDKLPFGIIFLQADGTVFRMNLVAKGILDAKDGILLEQGLLKAAGKKQDREIQAFLQQIRSDDDNARRELLVMRPSGKRPYTLLVPVLDRSDFWFVETAPAVVVFVSDPEQQRASPGEAFRRWYGLTEREVDLAMNLVQGRALGAVAERMGITENTARSYLRSVFRKTDTHRQGELVKLLLSLPPLIED